MPTKIERSMWYYSLKNMKRDFSDYDEEKQKIVELNCFEHDLMNMRERRIRAHISVSKKKDFGEKIVLSLNLLKINKLIIDSNRRLFDDIKKNSIHFIELVNNKKENLNETEKDESIIRFDDCIVVEDGPIKRKKQFGESFSNPDFNISALEINEEFNFQENDSMAKDMIMSKFNL